MKSKEEIKLMGEKYAITHEDVSDKLGKYLVSACFQDGYIQCQEDNDVKKYTEEDINEMACDFVINVGGLPKTIEEWQNALWKFYQSLNKQE